MVATRSRPGIRAGALQFRRRAGGDVHAPGFYLHLESRGGTQSGEAWSQGGCFMGLGIWRPDREALTAIREAIVEDPASWIAVARADDGFRSHFDLGGDSLKRGPVGFDRDHPLIDDIKRKDFIAVSRLSEEDVVSDGFVEDFAERCRAGGPSAGCAGRWGWGSRGVPSRSPRSLDRPAVGSPRP